MITTIASAITIIGFVYAFFRNFKSDIHKRMDLLDDRMFYLSTGKTIADAILEKKTKEK